VSPRIKIIEDAEVQLTFLRCQSRISPRNNETSRGNSTTMRCAAVMFRP